MSNIIDFIIVINFIILAIHLYKNKNLVNISFIIQIFILFNIFLYFRKWSGFIQEEPSMSFYIVCLSIIMIFYMGLIFSRKVDYKNIREIGFINKNAVLILNIIYLVLSALESYLVTGTIAPSIRGIDAHTLSVPVLNIITRNLSLILIINYIAYKYKKGISIIIFTIIHIIYYFIFRSARITVFTAILQVCIFIFIYSYKHINIKKILQVGVALFIVVITGVMIGNNRMNDFGKYDIKYSDAIRYTGPSDPIDLLAVYYGYFPMSYENLNLSINRVKDNKSCTYGLNTLAPINVGIFKLNKFEDYPYLEYTAQNMDYHLEAALVSTGFLEFYLDFRELMIISMIIYMGITIYFYNRMHKDISNIYIYSTLATCWAMMSFQNFMILPNTLYQIILFLIFRKLFIKSNNQKVMEKIYKYDRVK